MFTQAIAGHAPPKHLSSDNDPLFTFHRWRATLRVLEVDEIKTVPLVPCSHPFVERLIGTIRREYLDHVLFWNVDDLTRKLDRFRAYYNEDRVHRSLHATPAQESGEPPPTRAALGRYAWHHQWRGHFHTRWPLDEEFATHRSTAPPPQKRPRDRAAGVEEFRPVRAPDLRVGNRHSPHTFFSLTI